jgi:hypothetical protein
MSLKTIHISLARSPEFPNGNLAHAYEFRAPLDEDGRLDLTGWPQNHHFCTVKKFDRGVEVEEGLLLHTRNGNWIFSYKNGEDDDESIFRLSSHKFVPGEYLAITEHDGVQRTFQIDSVENWHPNPAESVNVARWPRS